MNEQIPEWRALQLWNETQQYFPTYRSVYEWANTLTDDERKIVRSMHRGAKLLFIAQVYSIALSLKIIK